MAIMLTFVGLLLLIAGGIGIFVTWSNYQLNSVPWIEGTITYGVFIILGLVAIIAIVSTPRET